MISKDEVISAQIEKETKMYKSHVSRTLKELRKKKLIKCMNPKDRNFKFYKITNLGKKVLEEILKIKS
jgi:DNA-binding MarR family transcriptional regulator|tara:strand:- start:829 stop:1032 length:204 start_codon:yes stop_codon:yes gene_type:complete